MPRQLLSCACNEVIVNRMSVRARSIFFIMGLHFAFSRCPEREYGAAKVGVREEGQTHCPSV